MFRKQVPKPPDPFRCSGSGAWGKRRPGTGMRESCVDEARESGISPGWAAGVRGLRPPPLSGPGGPRDQGDHEVDEDHPLRAVRQPPRGRPGGVLPLRLLPAPPRGEDVLPHSRREGEGRVPGCRGSAGCGGGRVQKVPSGLAWRQSCFEPRELLNRWSLRSPALQPPPLAAPHLASAPFHWATWCFVRGKVVPGDASRGQCCSAHGARRAPGHAPFLGALRVGEGPAP